MDKRKNACWSEGADDGKPYTSIKDWVDEIRRLIWPSIILIVLIIIITIILLTT